MIGIIVLVILVVYLHYLSYSRSSKHFEILQTDVENLQSSHFHEKLPILLEDNIVNTEYILARFFRFKYIKAYKYQGKNKTTSDGDGDIKQIIEKQLVTRAKYTLINCKETDKEAYILCNVPNKNEVYEPIIENNSVSKNFKSVRDDRQRTSTSYVHVKLYPGQILMLPPHWEIVLPEANLEVTCLHDLTSFVMN